MLNFLVIPYQWFCIEFLLASYHCFNRFKVEDRSVVSHLFHQWAKKQAFQEPKRLLDKVTVMFFLSSIFFISLLIFFKFMYCLPCLEHGEFIYICQKQGSKYQAEIWKKTLFGQKLIKTYKSIWKNFKK